MSCVCDVSRTSGDVQSNHALKERIRFGTKGASMLFLQECFALWRDMATSGRKECVLKGWNVLLLDLNRKRAAIYHVIGQRLGPITW